MLFIVSITEKAMGWGSAGEAKRGDVFSVGHLERPWGPGLKHGTSPREALSNELG